ncbi:MAG: pantoate--beta-alanine ligase [Phycisphaerales bacterium]|nr:pantoate--beta-alanine ligase [Phycisphaerales bacterium]
MQIVQDSGQLSNWKGCALIPTMGALHEGHLSLVRAAAREWSGPIVVTIFVNPTQFGNQNDLLNYPRTLEHDLEQLRPLGIAAAFTPSVEMVYPTDHQIWQPPLPPVAMTPQLEDLHRPEHFAGVAQVVARLVDLCQPQRLLLGEKDYQQLRVITEMVERESKRWPGLVVEGHPTIREPDGLAMSSRNQLLTTSERPRALGLVTALQAASAAETAAEAESRMTQILLEHALHIDYAVVRDATTLQPITSHQQPSRALVAAHLGHVRLIDNLATDFGSA